MKAFRTAVVTLALILVSGAGAFASADKLTIRLNELNGSGESGTAVFLQQADGLHVVMALAGAPKEIGQPAHLHIGTCTKNKATQYVLHDVLNGRSDTTLPDLKLSDLTSGTYVINVHESANNLSYYVACGAIK